MEIIMSIWNKFTAWLSGWPESKEKKLREDVYLFEEEEKMIRETNKNIGKKSIKVKPKKIKGLIPKKKKGKKQGNIS